LSREHYAWGSVRRTGRQLALLVLFAGLGLIAVLVMLLVFGAGE
jgi:hypothetical protein